MSARKAQCPVCTCFLTPNTPSLFQSNDLCSLTSCLGKTQNQPSLCLQLQSLAARVLPISISDDKSPAPQVAVALAQRLEEHGIGLESAFAALNVGGQPAGVKPDELRSSLENVFAIHCPEEVRTALLKVDWN